MRCVRTVRLGLPNTALLPYKMGGSLQRLLAVRGMGRDPQRREMGDAGSGARDWKGRSVPEFDGGTVRQADDKPVRSCRLPCSARRWVGRGCLLPATRRQLEELKLVQNTPSHGCLDDKAGVGGKCYQHRETSHFRSCLCSEVAICSIVQTIHANLSFSYIRTLLQSCHSPSYFRIGAASGRSPFRTASWGLDVLCPRARTVGKWMQR